MSEKLWRKNLINIEPCMMCTGAIIQSRIKKIYYAIENEKFGYLNKIDTKKIKIVKGNMTLESAQLLQKFFQNKR